jgi:hypothetical protein
MQMCAEVAGTIERARSMFAPAPLPATDAAEAARSLKQKYQTPPRVSRPLFSRRSDTFRS